METLVQGHDWLTYIEQLEPSQENSGIATPFPSRVSASPFESWEHTDRPLKFPGQQRQTLSNREYPSLPTGDRAARARWLKEHDVHTEFLDAGIGCCWYAYQGDEEPVCGETEEAAVEKLARQNGLGFSIFDS